ncbi:MAG TPA: PASTA domain-containing protein, partial [Cryptosporangiaceae bacterium]|nr:PASTA domain-containing protein [Cryptosporangiaceae bacterium]
AAAPDQRAGVHAAVRDRALTVDPGQSVTTVVTVHNTGTRVEEFRLSVQGPASAWASVEPVSVSVYPGQEQESTLRFAPPRSLAAPAGPAWYAVRATSTVHRGLEASTDGTLTVSEFHDLSAEMVPHTTRGRRRTVHTVKVTNRGNTVEPVRLDARDLDGVLRFGTPAAVVPVSPGKLAIPVTVRSPLRWVGQPKSHPFHVTVTPNPPSTPMRLDGNRDVVPLFAKWVPVTAVVLTVLLLLCGAGVGLVRQFDLISLVRGGQEQPSPSPEASETPGEQPQQQVPVPDVVGQRTEDAERALRDVGLNVEVERVQDPGQPADTVLQTDPSAGTQVDPGSTVKLTATEGG